MQTDADEIKCGDRFSRPAKSISRELIAATAEISGDSMVQYVLVCTLICAVLGKELPQSAALCSCQNQLMAEIKIGDEITAHAEVECFVNMTQGVLRLNTWCINQDGTIVAEGNATVRVHPSLLAFR